MRKILILVWMLIPVVAIAYHYGPGQEQVVLDDADKAIRLAEKHVSEKNWSAAIEEYDRAISLLPKNEKHSIQRLRVEIAKAQMMAAQLPEANKDLKTLVDEMVEDKNADPRTLADARSALANSQYYRTWLMRLEGLPRATWEPEIESARQIYKLLAEQTKDDVTRKKLREDLESTIRLARMDLKDLQGLPLPSQ